MGKIQSSQNCIDLWVESSGIRKSYFSRAASYGEDPERVFPRERARSCDVLSALLVFGLLYRTVLVPLRFCFAVVFFPLLQISAKDCVRPLTSAAHAPRPTHFCQVLCFCIFFFYMGLPIAICELCGFFVFFFFCYFLTSWRENLTFSLTSDGTATSETCCTLFEAFLLSDSWAARENADYVLDLSTEKTLQICNKKTTK